MSEISNVCKAMEGHCLQAMKIVSNHANGRFDWLISGTRALILREKQFLYCRANTKDLRLSTLWLGVYFTIHQCFTELRHYDAVAEDSINAAVWTLGTLNFLDSC